ncbi:carbohydrate phosphatase [Periconia macrospinosa]|uniref:Carbohydrate phosphatase n=1 Tax=Periconia macrospinosa TaxID=97972 RepID=A0A2V1EBB7_9PLEO|nr:carbohydrate phosphatase [Periconia macrospinosa]
MATSEYDVDYAAEHSLALQTIHAASRLTKQVLRSVSNNVSAETKADESPVTIADFAAQALIISALHAAYPDDSFLGEESADQLRSNDDLATSVWQLVQREAAQLGDVQHVQHAPAGTTAAANVRLTLPTSKEQMLDLIDLGTNTQTKSGRVWVMDPVDGTATFMTGNQYAVCLCLLVDGVQKLGVIGCPNLAYRDTDDGSGSSQRIHEDLVDTEGYGVVLSAFKGRGTYIRKMLADGLGEPKKMQHHHANAPKDPSTLNFIESTLGKTSLSQEEHKNVAEVLGAQWPGTVIWSQQMKYIALTLGATDVMLRLPKGKERYTAVWDHAGGSLLFQEAGGIIKDIDGGDIDFAQGRLLKGERNFGMIAALPGIWGAVDRAVKDVLQRRTK